MHPVPRGGRHGVGIWQFLVLCLIVFGDSVTRLGPDTSKLGVFTSFCSDVKTMSTHCFLAMGDVVWGFGSFRALSISDLENPGDHDHRILK